MDNVAYAVFEKLENYYDDNDRSLISLFSKRDDANNYVESHKYLNLFIEEVEIY